jgi:hypothetical protein
MDKARKTELKAAYKLALPPHGLYAIRNLTTGASYVATSTDLSGAMNRHRFYLAQGKHRCRPLQQDWNRLGEAGFVMEVLQRLEPRPGADFDPAQALAAMLRRWRDHPPERLAGLYNPAPA